MTESAHREQGKLLRESQCFPCAGQNRIDQLAMRVEQRRRSQAFLKSGAQDGPIGLKLAAKGCNLGFLGRTLLQIRWQDGGNCPWCPGLLSRLLGNTVRSVQNRLGRDARRNRQHFKTSFGHQDGVFPLC